MARGTYGQNEGNETRSSFAVFGDRIIENDIAEGAHVSALRKMASYRNWKAVTAYTDNLRKCGHSQLRVDSMISRATAGLRF